MGVLLSLAQMLLPKDVLSAQEESSSSFLVFCTSVIFLHVMTTSSSLGYAGLVLPHHTDPTSPLLYLSELQGTWFVTVSPIAMNLGVFLSIPLCEWLGRTRMFLVANFCSMLGYIAVFFAPNFPVLLTARFFQVCAMGLADISPGVYLTEISTVKSRGPLSGCNMTAGVMGTLFYTAICIFLPIRFLSLAFVVHNVIVLLMVLLLPESPQWLVRKGREADAKAALLRLRGSTYRGADLEVDEIRLCTRIEEETSHESLKQTFSSAQFTRPLATFSIVFLCVGLAGNDTMVFYGPTIFSQMDLGLPPSTLATLPWIGFSAGYALSSPIMARMNRVPQFVTFSSIMSGSLLCIGSILASVTELSGKTGFQTVLLVSLMVATTAYGLGVGAVPYTMLGEVFTPRHRNMGASMAQLVRGCTMVLLSSMVPTVINNFGLHFLFFFHGVVCAVAALFVWKFVPETRGKTLLELCSIYSSSSGKGSDNMTDTSSVSSVSDASSVSSYPYKSFHNSTLVEKFSSLGTQLDSSKSV